MYFKQAEVFTGLGHNFLQEVMAIIEKVAYEEGEYVFHAENPATSFFILILGQFSLLSESGETLYTSDGIGDIFGCSSLIGHACHFISARCDMPSVVLRIDVSRLEKILAADSEIGFRFYRQLAGALGERLRFFYGASADSRMSPVG